MNDAEWARAWAGAAVLDALPRGPVVATGGGLSAFAAQAFVAGRLARGQKARFVPLGAWAVGSGPRFDADGVVFSMGLSPNARLALASASFRRLWVVTAASPSACAERAPEATPLRLPAPPTPAPWGAIAVPLAAVAQDRDPTARRPTWTPQPAPRPELIVHGPGLKAEAEGLAWAWMEHARVPLPGVVEDLDFAHGPLQALRPGAGVWLLPTPGRAALFVRLRRHVVAAGGRCVDFGTHGGRLGGWVRAAASAAAEPPGRPSSHDDADLYGLDRPL